MRPVAPSPTGLAPALDGSPRAIRGADLEACLHVLVEVVRRDVAVPYRRRVRVTTGLPAGPASALVDPPGTTQFHYDDEPDGQEPTVTR